MGVRVVSIFLMLFIFTNCSEKKMGVSISESKIKWLQNEASRQLHGCIRVAEDGTRLYTPDGEGQYAALWTRDFCYMVENAFELMPEHDIKNCILYLLHGQREDGCIPDRVQTDGLAVYSAGPLGRPLGDPPTDNAQFMVKLVATFVKLTGDIVLFEQTADQLIAAMDYTPRSENGLVYIDPKNPHSPYGFTDTIQKTGELLFSSLLYWEAARALAHLFDKIGQVNQADIFQTRAQLIEHHINFLWNDQAGMFYAASNDCRQIDVWGSAYAIYIGFPLGEKNDRIVDFLARNFDRIVMKGQIRHLPAPDHWEKTLIPIRPETYQNGAYWGTASGWVASALHETHADLSRRIMRDLIDDYETRGPHECINTKYSKLNNYVASVTNPLGALDKLKLGGS